MTAPDPDMLSSAETLEAFYGLTSKELGLDPQAFAGRLRLWEKVTAQKGGTSQAQAAGVRVLALRAWVTALIGKADKFRAEGDITVERDVMARVALVQGWLAEAEAEALTPTGSAVADVFGPSMDGWGVEGESY